MFAKVADSPKKERDLIKTQNVMIFKESSEHIHWPAVEREDPHHSDSVRVHHAAPEDDTEAGEMIQAVSMQQRTAIGTQYPNKGQRRKSWKIKKI